MDDFERKKNLDVKIFFEIEDMAYTIKDGL